jgi:molecular chaperone DnaK
MAKIRMAGPVEDGGAREELLKKKLEADTPDSWIVIWGWHCPRRGKDALQIDAILICPRGIFVLEAKNWRGQIRGDSRDWEWQGERSTLRARSPIEKTRDRVFALMPYLHTALAEKRDLFDSAGARLKFWIGPYVVLLNRTADVSQVSDPLLDRVVIKGTSINESFFSSAHRQSWAKDLTIDQIEEIADAIFRPMAAPIVGVDFGTTNSAVAYFNSQMQIEMYHVAEERVLTPSLFAVERGQELVGLEVETALEELDRCRLIGLPPSINPRNVVFWIKKLLGRTFKEYQLSKEEYPFIVRQQQDVATPFLDNKFFSTEHIASAIIRALYDLARSRLGEGVEAVIPVPVRFTDRQRRTLEIAARKAGFKDVHLAIDEATAAAVFLAQTKDYNGTVAVYDLGGGTFDISVVEIQNGVTNVKAVRGDTRLGGYHFDVTLGDYLMTKAGGVKGLAALGVDDQYTLRRELERARKRLSSSEHTRLTFKNMQTGGLEQVVVTRKELESVTEALIGRSLELCEEALRAAKKNGAKQIDDVIMSGGLTFMPLIQRRVREFFFPNKPDKQLIIPDNPSVLVARGAAIYAAMLMGHIRYTRIGERVAPFSYGVDAYFGYPRDKNLYISVLIGRDEQLFDRQGTPQTFDTKYYYTIAENQKTLSFRVLQANMARTERKLAEDCITIGTLSLEIEAHPVGQNGVSVGFSIDKNGILEITYKELKRPTENEGKIRFNMLLKPRGEPTIAR